MRYDELTEYQGIKLDPVMFRIDDDLRKYQGFIKDETQDKDPSKLWNVFQLREPGTFLVISVGPKNLILQGWVVNTRAKMGWRYETLASKADIFQYLKFCGRGMLASHLQDIGVRHM